MQHGKSVARTECNTKIVQHEATREKVQREKSTTRKKCDMKRVQHGKRITLKKCNTKSVKHEKCAI